MNDGSIGLRQLHLTNFRLYDERVFTLGAGLNMIVGANGSGKSSLLEAMFVCLTGGSYRTKRTAELIRHGQKSCSADLLFQKHGVEHSLRYHYDGIQGTFFFNNGTALSRITLLGICPVVVFSQDDAAIVKGAPLQRRRYLDLQLVQSDPLYLHHLSRYTRAVRQRNSLLRSGAAEKVIVPWEKVLASSAVYLYRQRAELVRALQPLTNTLHHHLTREVDDALSLLYRPSSPGGTVVSEEAFLAFYQQNRSRERELGATLVGPHRDDVQILLNGKDVRAFASEGQQKSIVAALRLAEWELMRQRTELPPLLLIDDLCTSLDPKRRRELLHLTTQCGQVLATAVSEAEYEGVPVEGIITLQESSDRTELR